MSGPYANEDTYGDLGSGAPADPKNLVSVPQINPDLPPSVARYLMPNETSGNILWMRQHWASILPRILIAAAALALAAFINTWEWYHGGLTPAERNLIWLAWFLVTAWCAARVLSWYRTWIVITRVRMMMIAGLTLRRVMPLPIKRARDQELARPVLGQLLGYGTLTTQSFGTDHQLSIIRFVPDVDYVFNAVQKMISDPGVTGDPF